jgi:3-methyladenine DNA glycosylase AlkD
MKTVAQVMKALKKLGAEQTVKTFARHGAPANMYGVKVSDLKGIVKQIKGDQSLACELYETGNSDAMYLAGLVADGALMTKKQLDAWVKGASWYMLAEYTVAWVAAESPHGRDMAIKWMKSRNESIASSGWATYSSIVSTRPDEELDLGEIKELLKRVVAQIHDSQNRVRMVMNAFVIAVGGYVKPLHKQAKSAAKKIGKVNVDVDVGDTSCKVPLATEYIEKIEARGTVGKKRKTFKC